MKNRPLPVVIVSILFILVGVVGFASHLKELFQLNNNQNATVWILFVEIVAVACGLLLLFRTNWARWLAIAWLAYHIVISMFNSTSETIAHIVLLILISTLLFLPVSSTYFKNKKQA